MPLNLKADICILLFFTICILSTANSLKDEANEGYKKYITADAQVKKYFDDEYDEDYNEKQLATKRLTIDAIYQIKEQITPRGDTSK